MTSLLMEVRLGKKGIKRQGVITREYRLGKQRPEESGPGWEPGSLTRYKRFFTGFGDKPIDSVSHDCLDSNRPVECTATRGSCGKPEVTA